MIVAETARLLLRHVNHEDLDMFAGLFGDPEVMRFSSGIKSREETRRWIEGCLEDYRAERWGYGLWAVILKETGRVIGFCGLTKFDDIDGQPEVEIGYRFARSFWGEGLCHRGSGCRTRLCVLSSRHAPVDFPYRGRQCRVSACRREDGHDIGEGDHEVGQAGRGSCHHNERIDGGSHIRELNSTRRAAPSVP